MGSDDDRLAVAQTQIHDLRLHQGQRVIIDLDTQIAARYHHGVRCLHDRQQILDATLVFDFGHDARFGAEIVQQLAQPPHVLAFAHERKRHEIEARRYASAHIALVLLGQRRQADLDAG